MPYSCQVPGAEAIGAGLLHGANDAKLLSMPLEEYHDRISFAIGKNGVQNTVGVPDYVHGNEWCSGRAYELFKKFPLPGVEAIVVDEVAYEHNTANPDDLWRNSDTNPAWLFGMADDEVPKEYHTGYTHQRVRWLKEWIGKFDFAFEPHGTKQPYAWAMHGSQASDMVRNYATTTNAGSVIQYPNGLSQMPHVLGMDMPESWSKTYEHSLLTFIAAAVLGKKFKPRLPLVEYEFVADVFEDDLVGTDLPSYIAGWSLVPDTFTKARNLPLGTFVLAWDRDAYASDSNGAVGELIRWKEIPGVRRCFIDPARACSFSMSRTAR